MGLFATSTPPRRVVKLYGVENVFVALNLFMSAVMVSLGLWPPRESDLLRKVEADAQRMIAHGYRVVSSEHFELPWLHIAYERVTYERSEPAKAT